MALALPAFFCPSFVAVPPQRPPTLLPLFRPSATPPQPGTSAGGQGGVGGSATAAPPGSSIPPLPPGPGGTGTRPPFPNPQAGAASLPCGLLSFSRDAQAVHFPHPAPPQASKPGEGAGRGQRVPQTPAETSAPERLGFFFREKDVALASRRQNRPRAPGFRGHPLRVNSSPEHTRDIHAPGPVGTLGVTPPARGTGALYTSGGGGAWGPAPPRGRGDANKGRTLRNAPPKQATNPATEERVSGLRWSSLTGGPATLFGASPSSLHPTGPAPGSRVYHGRVLPLQGSSALAL